VSVMVVNQDHYINGILHDTGTHEISIDRFDTPVAAVAVRVLVDPIDPDDLAQVQRIQDGFGLSAAAARPFVMPDYDQTSFDTTRQALLTLAGQMTGFDHTFGAKADVDPIHHLIGTAAGWGGLPDAEATYIGVNPGLPVDRYEVQIGDVPVDAFWSISVYNADGYFGPNPSGVYSINSITALAIPTAPSRSASAIMALQPTPSRSPTGGTTSCACTAPGPTSSTAPGPSHGSRRPNRPAPPATRHRRPRHDGMSDQNAPISRSPTPERPLARPT
jgi:Protein of unknown function (DUF1214)